MSREKINKIEFVDSKTEQEEIKGFSLKGLIDGSIFTVKTFVEQIPFILFLVMLAIIYIANRYHAEKVVRNITSLKTEVKDLRAEQIITASELMNLSRPSSVEKLIENRGLELEQPVEPPLKIVYKDKH